MKNIATTRTTQPRVHQAECLEALVLAERQNQKTGLVVMAGGLGKTLTTAFYVKRRFEEYKESRCLYLCHKNESLEQAEREYKKVLPDATYGLFNGEEKINLRANILFASFQTMRDHLSAFEKEEFDIIVVDETHHVWAPTYEKTIRHFVPHFLLGITATPERMDRLDIRDIYGKELYHLSLVDALVRGLLCPVDYRLMSDDINSKRKIDTLQGRLSINLLNRTIFVPKRDNEIAEQINAEIAKIHNPRVMIFASSIEHAEIMAELIPGAVPIHSDVPKDERRLRLELFRQGAFKVAISVDMFTESLDVPEINLLVLLRITNSPTNFWQSLFRGMRLHESKKKLIVLDFVANCERIFAVYELWTRIKVEREYAQTTEIVPGVVITKKPKINPFTLNVEAVEFKEKIIPLIETISKLRIGYYATCQEASEAVMRLGIRNATEYAEKFKQDPQLVSMPRRYYEDFPGWAIFTGSNVAKRHRADVYPTWQEASKAALKLGITGIVEYSTRYKEDPKLPSEPEKVYSDFPGTREFFGMQTPYSTWQKAGKAAQALGIKTQREYTERYKEDPKLPSNPDKYYEGYPGIETFLGTAYYKTWREASKAAIKLGISNAKEFDERHAEDPRLPQNSLTLYKYANFPGMVRFFGGKEKVFYKTWKQASKAAQKLGVKSGEEYKKKYTTDPKLTAVPDKKYPDFPGWEVFLGTEKNFYPTWKEAGKAAVALGIGSSKQYSGKKKMYKQDSRLPANPPVIYPDFPGWKTFLAGTKKSGKLQNDNQPYQSWEEAAAAIKRLGIKSGTEYKQRYCEDDKLPQSPWIVYDDFPGWVKFFV